MERMWKMTGLWELHEKGLITEKDVVQLADSRIDYRDLVGTLKYTRMPRILKYLRGQCEAHGDGGGLERIYRDYIQECEQLGLNLEDRTVLFPRDLQAAHNCTMAQIDFRRNKADQEAFARQAEKLERWAWEKDGLLIRPARKQEELAEEGAALHHCVGRYAKRMAAGETAIFFVRKAEAPDEPCYTLELQGGRVAQCRTENNRSYESNGRVKAFVDAWTRDVVRAKRKKSGKKTKQGAVE